MVVEESGKVYVVGHAMVYEGFEGQGGFVVKVQQRGQGRVLSMEKVMQIYVSEH